MNKENLSAMKQRRSGYTRLNKAKFYLVTFDLKPSKGRNGVYAMFRDHLECFLGAENSHRIVKQCHFVRSNYRMSVLKAEMQHSLSSGDSILIARLQPGYAYSLRAPGAGKRAKEYFSQLREEESQL